MDEKQNSGHLPSWHSSAYYKKRGTTKPVPNQVCGYSKDEWNRERSGKIATVLAIVFALFPWGSSLPVAYKWPMWGVSIISVIYLVLTSIPPFTLWHSAVQKGAVGTAVVAVLVAFFWPVIHQQWKAQKASVIEGDIRLPVKSNNQPERTIELGTSGMRITFTFSQEEVMKMLYDSGLRLDIENNELKISTPIRDRFGHLVATIEKNHWAVTAACLDKNYTSNSLEILDTRGHVVFQMTLLPDRVQLQGEWRDEFGNGLRLANGETVFWRSPEQEQQLMRLIEPMFRYPSVNHWGEKRQFGD